VEEEGGNQMAEDNRKEGLGAKEKQRVLLLNVPTPFSSTM